MFVNPGDLIVEDGHIMWFVIGKGLCYRQALRNHGSYPSRYLQKVHENSPLGYFMEEGSIFNDFELKLIRRKDE